MRKLPLYFLAVVAVMAAFSSCSDTKTYAEMLSDQRNEILNFIDSTHINVISAATFNTMLDKEGKILPEKAAEMVKNNQYALFSNGLYLQIVNAGVGDTIKSRENVIVRYVEYNIADRDTTSFNVYMPNSQYKNMDSYYTFPDVFSYTQNINPTSGAATQLGTFTQGTMSSTYGTTVPGAWLYVINYIRKGAHVRMIVPADLGNSAATHGSTSGSGNGYLVPYFYDLKKMTVQ